MRTDSRHRLRFSALMAHQPLKEPMLHHPCIAMIAADLMPARPAERHRRIAATVEEDQRLLSRFQPLRHSIPQRWRHPRAARHILRTHVNRGHLRHHCLTKSSGQSLALILAGLDIRPAFKTWRGRGQHHLRPIDGCPKHGHVASIIHHPVFLLVRRVMLLIDDDQTKVLKGQKQR